MNLTNYCPTRYTKADLTQNDSLTLVELPLGEKVNLSVTGETKTLQGLFS